jgi:hypothetical protein
MNFLISRKKKSSHRNKKKLKRQWNSFEEDEVRHKIVINKNLKNSFLSHLLYVIAVAAALVAFFLLYSKIQQQWASK